jgi:hypothetical protein
VLGSLALTAVAATALVVLSPTAEAATRVPTQGNVFMVTPKFAGFCSGWGNQVTGVRYVVRDSFEQQIGSGSSRPNSDVIYPKVRFGQANIIDLAVSCRRSLPYELETVINAKKPAQTFFINSKGKVIATA